MENNSILIYQSADGKIAVDTVLQDETVWLTQEQMALLFGKGRSTITEHIRNVYAEQELIAIATSRKFRQVRLEGTREVERDIEYYNLDVIISVGYRVKSQQGTQFRIWATQRLKEYLLQGFSLNEEKLKSGKPTEYFDKLQSKLREIRLSERLFYQKVYHKMSPNAQLTTYSSLMLYHIQYHQAPRATDRVWVGQPVT